MENQFADILKIIQSNPCLQCGACCAFYRVSFYWAEATDGPAGSVPVQLTENLPPFRRIMKGTGHTPPRCVALEGSIGESVFCSIYEKRPSPCRSFEISWKNKVHNSACDEARKRWGLPAINPPHEDHPDDPGHYPRAA